MVHFPQGDRLSYMSFLQWCDTAASRQHWIIHGLYLSVKWYLVALGAFAILRLSLDRMGLWSLY